MEEESLEFQITGLSNVSRLETGGNLQMPVAFVLINTESGSVRLNRIETLYTK